MLIAPPTMTAISAIPYAWLVVEWLVTNHRQEFIVIMPLDIMYCIPLTNSLSHIWPCDHHVALFLTHDGITMVCSPVPCPCGGLAVWFCCTGGGLAGWLGGVDTRPVAFANGGATFTSTCTIPERLTSVTPDSAPVPAT